MENHGTPFAKRWKILRERIEAMKAIWANENAEYHGEFVDFDPIWQYPKPLTRPHPPIILGTATPNGRQRVVDYCDGWIPIDLLIQDLPAAIADLRRRAEKAGRDPRSIPISIFWAKAEEAELRKYQSMGVERAILGVPAAPRDEVLPILDQYAELARKLA
jgi:alkanesulfonate monooxygenase SsuD/methylene tetrahydromethanopterin reductase-like flavin-dependent oxidoreductase (luciferase family)